MHIYHAGSGAPVVAILRPARTPKGTEVRTVIKHVTKHLRRHWPTTRIVWRGDGHYGRVEAIDWADEHDNILKSVGSWRDPCSTGQNCELMDPSSDLIALWGEI